MKDQPDLFRQMDSTAVFSPCREYRFELWRRWGADDDPFAMFIGLNPSTADETKDDPTIRRCIRFAKDWGYGGLLMANAFAYRATDPKVMKAATEPGEMKARNFLSIDHHARRAGVVVAAWGVHGTHQGRDAELLAMIPGLKALGFTIHGHPRHPLYMPADSKPLPFPSHE